MLVFADLFLILARVILILTSMNKTSDYILYDTALNSGFRLLKDNKKYRIGFYIIFSINTGLRISDVLQIRHIDLVDDKSRIGVCIDTCHAYSAGYDFKTKEGFEKVFKECTYT